MNEDHAARDLAGAVLDGEDVDWHRTAQDAHIRRLAAPLVGLDSARSRLAGAFAVDGRPTPTLCRLTTSTLVAITIYQLLAAAAGFWMGVDATTPVPAGGAIMAVAAFSLAAAWLFLGGRSDGRARILAIVFLLIASAFARRFTGIVGDSPTAILVRGVFPDAFLPAFAWAFARHFPRVVRRSRWDAVARSGTLIATAVGAFLFAINVVHVHVPNAIPRVMTRGHPRSIYWAMVVGLSVIAILVTLLRARAARSDERRRVSLFGLALTIPLLPVALEILAEIASSEFKRTMAEAVTRTAVAPVLFALLLSVPILTTYTVLVGRVLEVRLVLAKTLQYLFARATLTIATAVPLILLGGYAYQHRDLALASLLSGWQGAGLAFIAGCAVVGLTVHRRVLSAIQTYLLGAPANVSSAMAQLSPALRGSRTAPELAERIEPYLRDVVGACSTRLMLIDQGRRRFVSMREVGGELTIGSAIASLVSSDDSPVPVGPGQPGSYYALLPAHERQWVDELSVAVLVPLVDSQGALLGMVAVGPKTNGAPLGYADLEFLGLAGSAVGLASESLRARYETPVWTDDQAAGECAVCGIVAAISETRCECGGTRVVAAVPVLVAGKFRVQQRLGAGGMGVAYLGADLTLRRRAVLKTLSRVSAAGAQRLSEEAHHMASVVHPNLATIFGIEWWRGSPILVVEYLEGGTLARRMAKGPLPVGEVLRTGAALASALGHLHHIGLLHRDVKPSNIAYSRLDDTPKLLDFGLATIIGRELAETPEAECRDPFATSRFCAFGGTIVGTPLYMAPEALDGAEPASTWDVWALAITLYEALAGQHPFAASTLPQVIRRVRDGRVPDLRSVRPDCPAGVSAALAAALAPDPRCRPKGAVAFQGLLETCERTINE